MKNPLAEITREVSREEAPHLHTAVEELCRAAGIEKPTICFITNTQRMAPLQQFTFEHIAGAIHIDKPTIVLGERMRNILGHPAAGGAINEDFRAVLAHEIGHLKHGDVRLHKILPLRFSPILGMVAGAAGMWYYEHLQAKKATAIAAGIPEAQAHAAIEQEWKTSDQSPIPMPPTYDHHVSAAKVISGGLLGFGVGAAVFTLGHRHIEFRADRVSAELMGDGKPLARALQTVRSGFRQSAREAGPELVQAARKESPVIRFFKSLMHPSDAERIERLNAWSR